MKVFICTILIKIFQKVGSWIFTDRIDVYDEKNIKGVIFSSDPNFIGKVRMFIKELNNGK